jgi:hypothetical protein
LALTGCWLAFTLAFDGHREETFGLIHPLAAFYSLLLRAMNSYVDGHFEAAEEVGWSRWLLSLGGFAHRWPFAWESLLSTFSATRYAMPWTRNGVPCKLMPNT